MNIETYQLTYNSILVYTADEKEHTVNRSEFEDWLDDSGKLDWILDWSEAGEHKQASGKMTIQEYWGSVYRNVVEEDLKEFMSLHITEKKQSA